MLCVLAEGKVASYLYYSFYKLVINLITNSTARLDKVRFDGLIVG